MADYITVNVHEETWNDLNQLKRPGDSFNDVINRLLDYLSGYDEDRIRGAVELEAIANGGEDVAVDVTVECPVDGCPKRFFEEMPLRAHVGTVHPDADVDEELDELEFPLDTETSDGGGGA